MIKLLSFMFSLQNWVNPSYENVNHINQSWTLSDRFDILLESSFLVRILSSNTK